jgi:hypothetical protein
LILHFLEKLKDREPKADQRKRRTNDRRQRAVGALACPLK